MDRVLRYIGHMKGPSVVSARMMAEWSAVCGDLNGDTAIASHSSQKNACAASCNREAVNTMRAWWKAIKLRGRRWSVDEWREMMVWVPKRLPKMVQSILPKTAQKCYVPYIVHIRDIYPCIPSLPATFPDVMPGPVLKHKTLHFP